MKPILISCGDDFLLERQLERAVFQASESLGEGAEVERLSEEAEAESIAEEILTPSLFASSRVLVVPAAERFFELSGRGKKKKAAMDPAALIAALESEDEATAVVFAAHHARPVGSLVKAVASAGEHRHLDLPESPKPWETVVVSGAQRRVLDGLLAEAAPAVRFEPAATELLYERLGFDPRRLDGEARKLASSCADGLVDRSLVERLVFPSAASLDGVQDAFLERRPAAIIELLVGHQAGRAVHGYRGELLDETSLSIILLGQLGRLVERLYWLRRALPEDLRLEMQPDRVNAPRYYARTFKPRLGPKVLDAISADRAAPWDRAPGVWGLGKLFVGAANWLDDELEILLAGLGETEARLRGDQALVAFETWLMSPALGQRD